MNQPDGSTYNQIDTTESGVVGGYVGSVGFGSISVVLDTSDTPPSVSSADSMVSGGYGNLVYVSIMTSS